MNSIIQAMRIAGVPTLPQTQRIWMWLNDHQPQSAKQIATAMKLPQASSLLCQMEKRGMVTSTVEHDRFTGHNSKMFRTVGKEYQLLPRPLKPVVPKPTAQVFALRFQPIDPAEPVQCSQAGPTAFDIDTLTIAEARALYKRLATMFQGEAA